jgi:hypothetical protein
MIRKNTMNARERAEAGFEILLENLKMERPEWGEPDPTQIEVMRMLYMAGFENGAEFVYDEMGSSATLAPEFAVRSDVGEFPDKGV